MHIAGHISVMTLTVVLLLLHISITETARRLYITFKQEVFLPFVDNT